MSTSSAKTARRWRHLLTSYEKDDYVHSWPEKVRTVLAEHGFAYSPIKANRNRLRCVFCKQHETYDENSGTPGVLQDHLSSHPECHASLIAMASLNEHSSASERITRFQSSGNSAITEPFAHSSLLWRLDSFRDFAKLPPGCPTPRQMAEAGFIFSQARPDQVYCIYCGLALDSWEVGDDPIVEHANHHSGYCFYLRTFRQLEELNSEDSEVVNLEEIEPRSDIRKSSGTTADPDVTSDASNSAVADSADESVPQEVSINPVDEPSNGVNLSKSSNSPDEINMEDPPVDSLDSPDHNDFNDAPSPENVANEIIASPKHSNSFKIVKSPKSSRVNNYESDGPHSVSQTSRPSLVPPTAFLRASSEAPSRIGHRSRRYHNHARPDTSNDKYWDKKPDLALLTSLLAVPAPNETTPFQTQQISPAKQPVSSFSLGLSGIDEPPEAGQDYEADYDSPLKKSLGRPKSRVPDSPLKGRRKLFGGRSPSPSNVREKESSPPFFVHPQSSPNLNGESVSQERDQSEADNHGDDFGPDLFSDQNEDENSDMTEDIANMRIVAEERRSVFHDTSDESRTNETPVKVSTYEPPRDEYPHDEVPRGEPPVDDSNDVDSNMKTLSNVCEPQGTSNAMDAMDEEKSETMDVPPAHASSAAQPTSLSKSSKSQNKVTKPKKRGRPKKSKTSIVDQDAVSLSLETKTEVDTIPRKRGRPKRTLVPSAIAVDDKSDERSSVLASDEISGKLRNRGHLKKVGEPETMEENQSTIEEITEKQGSGRSRRGNRRYAATKGVVLSKSLHDQDSQEQDLIQRGATSTIDAVATPAGLTNEIATVSTQPDHVDKNEASKIPEEINSTDATANPEAKPKKRGRGRPRKVKEVAITRDDAQIAEEKVPASDAKVAEVSDQINRPKRTRRKPAREAEHQGSGTTLESEKLVNTNQNVQQNKEVSLSQISNQDGMNSLNDSTTRKSVNASPRVTSSSLHDEAMDGIGHVELQKLASEPHSPHSDIEPIEVDEVDLDQLRTSKQYAERVGTEDSSINTNLHEKQRLEAKIAEPDRSEAKGPVAARVETTVESDQEAVERERERQEVQRQEAERQEAKRQEEERLEKERLEKERLEKERLEKERLEKERLEKERQEKERFEMERLEMELQDKERQEKERLEKERLEKERLEKERQEKEQQEKVRLEKEQQETERQEKERQEKERQEKERQEKERQEAERFYLNELAHESDSIVASDSSVSYKDVHQSPSRFSQEEHVEVSEFRDSRLHLEISGKDEHVDFTHEVYADNHSEGSRKDSWSQTPYEGHLVLEDFVNIPADEPNIDADIVHQRSEPQYPRAIHPISTDVGNQADRNIKQAQKVNGAVQSEVPPVFDETMATFFPLPIDSSRESSSLSSSPIRVGADVSEAANASKSPIVGPYSSSDDLSESELHDDVMNPSGKRHESWRKRRTSDASESPTKKSKSPALTEVENTGVLDVVTYKRAETGSDRYSEDSSDESIIASPKADHREATNKASRLPSYTVSSPRSPKLREDSQSRLSWGARIEELHDEKESQKEPTLLENKEEEVNGKLIIISDSEDEIVRAKNGSHEGSKHGTDSNSSEIDPFDFTHWSQEDESVEPTHQSNVSLHSIDRNRNENLVSSVSPNKSSFDLSVKDSGSRSRHDTSHGSNKSILDELSMVSIPRGSITRASPPTHAPPTTASDVRKVSFREQPELKAPKLRESERLMAKYGSAINTPRRRRPRSSSAAFSPIDFDLATASTPKRHHDDPPLPEEPFDEVLKSHQQNLNRVEAISSYLRSVVHTPYSLHDDADGVLSSFVAGMPEHEKEMTIEEWINHMAKITCNNVGEEVEQLTKVYEKHYYQGLSWLEALETDD
ncbi:hypothetical protein DIURU_002862 [Diutina rugosa]|uniref:BIR-domain-containing protein n=1 Tax=Diutina rugosa TaxID=5481 RepID=A0A642UQF7_DIURU|nr:uncharacterized protein DIURU_002862 [Diutina rugosa]KAA8902408.1 hypothetical protein DIURU_002862 [Diutina rugosa]